MLWLSADLSKSRSGLALWRGSDLLRVATVRAVGSKGRHAFLGRTHDTDIAAWQTAFRGPGDERIGALVHEAGLGHHMTTSRILAEHRGGVLMLWRLASGGGPVVSVNVNEWRRVAREAWGVSWPKDGAACKALAVQLVREHYGRDVTKDEADAVLVGHWALRTRAIEVTKGA